MLGMALGALLTHIRHKAQTARIVQELVNVAPAYFRKYTYTAMTTRITVGTQ